MPENQSELEQFNALLRQKYLAQRERFDTAGKKLEIENQQGMPSFIQEQFDRIDRDGIKSSANSQVMKHFVKRRMESNLKND